MAGLIVMFITRMLRLIADLNAAREELARLAVADERLRFARDLHDLLGHTLSLIVVKSEAVRRLVHSDADAAARESGDIETVSRQALAEVREAVTNYRERSLEAELEGARIALSAAGIEATIHQSAERLPDTVESVLGWTVREGVTNVVRHSNGRHCAIDVRQVDGVAVLEICDDGDAETAGSAVTAAAGGAGRYHGCAASADVRGAGRPERARWGRARRHRRLQRAGHRAGHRAAGTGRTAGRGPRAAGGGAAARRRLPAGGLGAPRAGPARIGLIRVLLAEDQGMMRGALALLLSMEPDIEIVAQVGSGDAVVSACRRDRARRGPARHRDARASGLAAARLMRDSSPTAGW